jgi:alpha-glucosidase
MTWLEAPEGCLAFQREGGLVCLVNFTNHPVTLPSDREVLLTSVPLVEGKLPGDAAVWLV